MSSTSRELSKEFVGLEGELQKEPTQRVLRTHDVSYMAQKKRGHEALVSVCYAKTGKRVVLSVKQLKKEIDYDGEKDWLDIRYDDVSNAILIAKSDTARGVKPIVTQKKYIIYSKSIVEDFVDTLGLTFGDRSCISTYVFEKEKIDAKDFIVISGKDFS